MRKYNIDPEKLKRLIVCLAEYVVGFIIILGAAVSFLGVWAMGDYFPGLKIFHLVRWMMYLAQIAGGAMGGYMMYDGDRKINNLLEPRTKKKSSKIYNFEDRKKRDAN